MHIYSILYKHGVYMYLNHFYLQYIDILASNERDYKYESFCLLVKGE